MGVCKAILPRCRIFFPASYTRRQFNSKTILRTDVKNNIQVPEKLSRLMQLYEDFFGLTDVKLAQNEVLAAEKRLAETQEIRRERQLQLQKMQSRLKEIHFELDKTSRGEDRYIHLITQERDIIKEEKTIIEEFKMYEKKERDDFSALSSSVRNNHEKERAQADKTKYWSIIGSICGAMIGIIGTTINNRLRMRELRGLVEKSGDNSKIQEIMSHLSKTVEFQQTEVQKFVSEMRNMLGDNVIPSAEGKTTNERSEFNLEKVHGNEILEAVKKHEDELLKEMRDLKNYLATKIIRTDDDNQDPVFVYVGDDVPKLLRDTQSSLEWKIKMNSLATVAYMYGTLVVAVPLIYFFFRG